MKKNAFTLAEVLITLGIIGVVAAMTLPALMADYKAKELEVRFKKAQSVIWNIHQRMIADYGSVYGTFIQKDVIMTDNESEKALRYKYIEAFMKYVNGGKICTWGNAILSCMNKSNPVDYKTYDGKNTAHLTADAVTDRVVVAPDGITIFFGNTEYRNNRIYVDTNGALKGPNRLGFDLFALDVDANDKIIPPKTFGGGGDDLVTDSDETGTTADCSIKQTGNKYNGFGCTIYAMLDKNPDNPEVSYWKNLPK